MGAAVHSPSVAAHAAASTDTLRYGGLKRAVWAGARLIDRGCVRLLMSMGVGCSDSTEGRGGVGIIAALRFVIASPRTNPIFVLSDYSGQDSWGLGNRQPT